ncbi:MAG: hypothetical protein LUC60_06215 [Lachnospiraceae bacterium]|nr:hypothetical protein [Lachnospiraceae bacterium]
MADSMSRILIETIVRRTLKDLKDSPERSIRNLVDMALNSSEGRFQRSFFTVAEAMLKNENSAYYDIIKDTVANVETDRILQFGMNLGYNSCTEGAEKIRKKEAADGFNIPWTISMDVDMEKIIKEPECYDAVLTQGKKLGIYTWMLHAHGLLQEVLPLMRRHTDCAFILFCEPSDLTSAFLDCMTDVKHLMLAVRYDENAGDVYSRLRKRQLFYSVFYVYEEKDADSIVGGDLFYSTEQLHPVFTAVLPDVSCSQATRDRVYSAITGFHTEQDFQTLPLDMVQDIRYIDGVISGDACLVSFDEDGGLYSQKGKEESLNIFDQQLENILRQAFSKDSETF